MICTWASIRRPILTCRGSKKPLPFATKTTCSVPESSTAFTGTTSAALAASRSSTLANMPGLSRLSWFGN